jgi:hypothetical protein
MNVDCRSRLSSAYGVKSTITTSEVCASTQSDTVSRTQIPVIERTSGAVLSICYGALSSSALDWAGGPEAALNRVLKNR